MDGGFVFDEIFHLAFLDRAAFFDDNVVLCQLAGHQEILLNQYNRRFCRELRVGLKPISTFAFATALLDVSERAQRLELFRGER